MQPPLLHKWTTPSEMCQFLTMLVFSHERDGNGWYLDMQPVGYRDNYDQKEWENFPDASLFGTFSSWPPPDVQSPLPRTQIVGMFCSWSDAWLKREDGTWIKSPWHTWVAILRPLKSAEKDLIIWDPEYESRGSHA